MQETLSEHAFTDAASLLQRLLQFDTSNPPGNEAPCISFIKGLLEDAGVQTTVIAKDSHRPNLIARFPGTKRAAPLLLYGHVDVVPARDQVWKHSPFSGHLEGGYIWGRGALDMKGGVAMMVSTCLRIARGDFRTAGDLILCLLSDEEAGGRFGAKFVTGEHPEMFAGVKYAIGEFGGFSLTIRGTRFYPIQVAEKQICQIKATVHGPGGHGSMPPSGGTMAALAKLLRNLDRRKLPFHVTPAARQTITGLADNLPLRASVLLRLLLRPGLAPLALRLLGPGAALFEPLVRHTANATIVKGGEAANVIPSSAEIEIDGRVLPGFGADDLLRELIQVVDDDVKFEVVRFDSGPEKIDMALFEMLAGVIREMDPEGKPVPLLLPGVTDARWFARLGIQTYGFIPMRLDESLNFLRAIHGPDERVPVESIEAGAAALASVVQRIGRQ